MFNWLPLKFLWNWIAKIKTIALEGQAFWDANKDKIKELYYNSKDAIRDVLNIIKK